MKIVITGYCKMTNASAGRVFMNNKKRMRKVRPVHELDTLLIAAVSKLLDCAGIAFPLGNAHIGMYIGIDDSIEEIKNDYFSSIIREGIMGVSPLIFPFTSPNALAAQASVAFDIRGECITLSGKNSFDEAVQYGVESLFHHHILTAIAGSITKNKTGRVNKGMFTACFLFLEPMEEALKRKQPFISLTEEMIIDESIWTDRRDKDQ